MTASSLAVVSAFVVSVWVADSLAGPPTEKPLMAELPAAAAAPLEPLVAFDGQFDDRAHLFYYSSGQKIFLYDSGLALAKVKAGRELGEIGREQAHVDVRVQRTAYTPFYYKAVRAVSGFGHEDDLA